MFKTDLAKIDELYIRLAKCRPWKWSSLKHWLDVIERRFGGTILDIWFKNN
jgi:hypothetical protein